jgi:hypothetical protein
LSASGLLIRLKAETVLVRHAFVNSIMPVTLNVTSVEALLLIVYEKVICQGCVTTQNSGLSVLSKNRSSVTVVLSLLASENH